MAVSHFSVALVSSLALLQAAHGRGQYSGSFGPRSFSLSKRTALSPSLLELRGGSTAVAEKPSVDAECQYRVQQQLLLQTRSVMLRQALIDRGLDALQFTTTDADQAKPTDWDCAVAMEESPKSCLYSFDAQLGHKVIAPRDTTQWITLTALNRLRRTDPSKVEPLWHSQYSILQAWFNPNSPHSLYTYLSPRAALLSFVLDAPMALGAALALTIVTLFLLTLPLWEAILTNFLTSSFLWLQWPNWGRFVHAAFPLKLLLGQMAWKAVASALGRLHGQVRSDLIELECQLWEDCIPRTIIEGKEQEGSEEQEEDDEYDNAEGDMTGSDSEDVA
mmetsp:Transcript_20712/g.26733  ORF Transcript_20712/g.26733 Transcript_20712/m.26733 type:complete len:333 (-) Transcript_20712:122-1120(-)|eukprot:CAMPEP_0198143814 /NCGR_PEP_ID=MMETSP1443-20131203/10458_1 /TAXON_ID=186043 /ORGANISM="Entomoneis sp., Strain CCMP2396" /LENGTH=332 /DNA_ID=CAMNT_0043807101 /DNA_START=124 /DNA_END=1122 /DNA_ORIENTATION=+